VTKGYLNAELKDGTVPNTYRLCAKVNASNIIVDVPNLEFIVLSDKITSSDQTPYVIRISSTYEKAQIITFD